MVKKRLQASLRIEETLKLRLQGYSFRQIASELGYTDARQAMAACTAALQDERPVAEDRGGLRTELDASLRALQKTWMPRALVPKPGKHTAFAAEYVAKLIAQRADLWGLNLGKQVERDGFSEALIAVLEEWVAKPITSVAEPTPEHPALRDANTLEAVWEEMAEQGEVAHEPC